jgi:16S rRNA (adenine1518-N6/adenine1519-N6)-dimethyltransferase
LEKIKPYKSLGQNFLTDMNIRKKIVNALGIIENDYVIEIGPGTGALTELILDYKVDYTGIEIDKRAVEVIERLIGERKNARVINQDILKTDSEIITSGSKIVGNLPYYITSSIIFKILESKQKPEIAVFMVQKEVAQRLTGRQNTKDNGILAIAINLLGEAKLLFDVSPNCFYPKPKVTSSVISLKFTRKLENFKEIITLVKMAFNQRRKTLSNSISAYFNEIDKTKFEDILGKRAEQLSADDFISLYNRIKYEKDNK